MPTLVFWEVGSHAKRKNVLRPMCEVLQKGRNTPLPFGVDLAWRRGAMDDQVLCVSESDALTCHVTPSILVMIIFFMSFVHPLDA